MSILKDFLKTIILSATVLFLVGIAYAWTEPSSNPPSGNTSAPITTGSSPQTKPGWLTLDYLETYGNTYLATTAGNVGIGTTAPGAKLNVDGGNILIGSSSGGNTRLEWDGTSNIASLRTARNGSVETQLAFWTQSPSGAFGERVRITGSGNVGIGTAGPNAKLEVAGDLLIRAGGAATAALGNLNIRNDNIETVAKTYSTNDSSDIIHNIYYVPADNYMRYYDIVGLGNGNGTQGGSTMRFFTNQNTNDNGVVRMVINNNGNVGIGTTGPGEKLDVAGRIKSSSGGFVFPDNSVQTTATSGGISAGAVMFFNLAACPAGWDALTAAQGRYLVGLPSAGTLGATSGTALSDLESRPVGQHTHSITDPAHGHSFNLSGDPTYRNGGYPRAWSPNSPSVFQINQSATNITINNSGTVTGTNAPYMQLLVCQKS